MIRPQIRHMLFVCRAKQISLRLAARWMPQTLFEAGIKRNGVERHLDTGRGRELRPHPAHALACRSLALGRFPLDPQNIFASRGNQVIGNARANNPSANDDNFRCMHELARTPAAKVTQHCSRWELVVMVSPKLGCGWRPKAEGRKLRAVCGRPGMELFN